MSGEKPRAFASVWLHHGELLLRVEGGPSPSERSSQNGGKRYYRPASGRTAVRAIAAFGREANSQKSLSKLFRHRAAEFLRVDDRHREPMVARHIVADADGDELDRPRVSISSIT
jgi:hypothetical protein